MPTNGQTHVKNFANATEEVSVFDDFMVTRHRVISSYCCVGVPFSSQCPLLMPLKTEKLWFSDVFRGIKTEHWDEKGLGKNKKLVQNFRMICIWFWISEKEIPVFNPFLASVPILYENPWTHQKTSEIDWYLHKYLITPNNSCLELGLSTLQVLLILSFALCDLL